MAGRLVAVNGVHTRWWSGRRLFALLYAGWSCHYEIITGNAMLGGVVASRDPSKSQAPNIVERSSHRFIIVRARSSINKSASLEILSKIGCRRSGPK